jgi:hypothetical protein
MAVVFFGIAYLVAAGIYALVIELATKVHVHARSFSPGMLSPAGTLFALFVVFTAAQVWSDNDRARAAVSQEASALRATVIFAGAFPGEAQEHLIALIRSHVEEAANEEWPMMEHQTATLNIIPHYLAEALQYALALKPDGQGQEIAQREMAAQLESALEARRQRVLISHSAVGWVKWSCLVIEAICVLLAVALVHCDDRIAAMISLSLFATGAAACLLLIAAYDRPFIGKLSIGPGPLLQVMPDAPRTHAAAQQ